MPVDQEPLRTEIYYEDEIEEARERFFRKSSEENPMLRNHNDSND